MSFRCPSDFEPEAKKSFRRLFRKFKASGRCNDFTFPVFISLCENYAALSQAHIGLRLYKSLVQETQSIDIAGVTHLTYKEIPYLKIVRDLESSIMKSLKFLGLNDSLGVPDSINPMEKLMDKGTNGKNKQSKIR